ncbi:MAG: pyridoxamine 5'-phosphate oxidase family protein [Pseudomonadota bacterium]
MDLNPDFIVKDEADLRGSFGATHELAIKKCLDHVDQHAAAFIARSPFLCIGTQSVDGTADVSPRGDPAGFVQILDSKTLLIPDRPGNNRLDTLSNIVANPTVGILLIIPGFDDTMRVNGRAKLTRDPDLLARCEVNDRIPTIGIVVEVSEVFIHCAKAFRRSKLWDPNALQDRKSMPSLVQIIDEQIGADARSEEETAARDEALEQEYRATMY